MVIVIIYALKWCNMDVISLHIIIQEHPDQYHRILKGKYYEILMSLIGLFFRHQTLENDFNNK